MGSRKSSATAEGLQSYKELIATATGDLEDRLQGIDEKLEIVVGRTVEASDEDAAELRQIKEERTSTQKCLEICSRLSDQIDLIKLTPKRSGDPTEDTEPGSLPERVTNDGLQECKDSLAATAAKLEKYMQELIDRMIEKSKTGAHSTEDLADLARLRDEWLTTRQCRDICSKADNSLKGSVSVIDNYATGDAIQFMVSTNDKTIHGTNRGLGWKTRQVGGHLSDTTIQQLSRDMAGGAFRNSVHNDRSAHGQLSPIADDTVKEGPKSQFSDRYGPGLKLTHQTTPNVAMPSTNSGESRRNSPPGQ